MKIKTFLNRTLWVCAATFLSLLCIFQSVFVKTANAEETTNTYTDVLEDLQKDENFNPDDYPAVADDYSLQVIQIAESVNNELFVYVYQPSDETKDLVATEIRMSTPEIGIDSTYKDYQLVLLSSQGLFDKYKVSNFTVKSSSVRYYEIVQLSRVFDSTIDKGVGNGNIATTVACPVGELWTVCNIDNSVSYKKERSEVITVTAKVVGFIRYADGYNLFSDSCDSHFVAFSTDHNIDNLVEASVDYISTFTKHEYNAAGFGTVDMGDGTTIIKTSRYTYDEPVSKTAELAADVYVDFDAGGIFSRTYSWKEIEKSSDFLSNESEKLNLSTGSIEALKNTQWILRFYNSPYHFKGQSSLLTWTKEYEKVSDVTILRLRFVIDDIPYNLGVVDNKQTGSDIPMSSTGKESFDWLAEVLTWILGVCMIGALIVAIIYFCPWVIFLVGKGLAFVFKWIVKILKWKIKFLWRIITFPFKLIGRLFHRNE